MRVSVFAAGVVLTLALLVTPAFALQGAVLLPFGAQYARPDGGTATHRGIDVDLQAGAAADSPRAGVVRFVGRVPSATGGTVLAVSIDTAEGVVTMLPLESAAVVTGDRLAESEEVGTLAASGDASSPTTHLHLGLKRGDVYLDPSALLVPASPLSAEEPSPVPVTAAEGGPLPAPQAQPAPAPSAAAAPETVAAGQTTVDVAAGVTVVAHGATAGEARSDAAPAETEARQEQAGATSRAGAPTELPSGVSLATPLTAPVGGATVAGASASAAPGAVAAAGSALDRRVTVEGTARDSVTAHRPRATRPSSLASFDSALTAPAVGLLAAALCAGSIVMTRRALSRRITASGPVSDRLGNLLQHLKAGDTLCGLTSCSGETAFTVPGPLAQRR